MGLKNLVSGVQVFEVEPTGYGIAVTRVAWDHESKVQFFLP